MEYLVSLYFDDKTDRRIRSYIALAAKAGGNSYMTEHHVPPHITISAFEAEEEETVIEHLEGCAARLQCGLLQWVTIGSFPTGVLYLAPVLNEYLHELAVIIHENISGMQKVNVNKYYRPFQWLPHATIAKKLRRSEMQAAFEALQPEFSVFQGKAVRIGLAAKNPYREIREWELGE